MDGGISFGQALAKVFWYVGEISFKLVPGTVASITGTDVSGTGPIPAGLTPIADPVTTNSIISFLEKTSSPERYNSLVSGWGAFVSTSMVISLLLMAVIIYCSVRIRQVRHMERMKFEAAAHPVAAKDVPRTQLRWNRIMEQARSENEQSWRLAILEADIMLNELLDMKGYKGDTMADKMKQIDKADFNTIDDAWDAHKVRNRIAHDGSAHQLNDHETRRVISLYEHVFKEAGVIQ
ncbi:MAG: hypothetical protein Q7S05_03810 [bacterium]|nr:hypothetical protein [bacterium]